MKKVLSILLCVVMLLGIAPLAAFAAEKITYVDCYFEKFYAGNSVSFYPEFTEDAGYQSDIGYQAESVINGVKWVKNSDTFAERLNEDSVLEAGATYTVTIYLIPKRGYEFQRGDGGELQVNGYVNDQDAYVVDEFDRISVSYTFECEEKTTVDILGVSVNINTPVAGEHPNYEASVNGDTYRVDEYFFEGSYNYGMMWVRVRDTYFLDEDDVFEAGETYRAVVKLCPKDGYSFASNNILNPDALTVNVQFKNEKGEEIDGWVSGGEADDWASVACEMEAAANPLENSTTIEKIEFTCTAPTAGAKPVFRVSVPSNAPYTVDTSYNESGFINGVRWWDCKALVWLGANDTFETNGVYIIGVWVKAKDGYCFENENSATKADVYCNQDPNGWAEGGETPKVLMTMANFQFGGSSGDDEEYNIEEIKLTGTAARLGAKPNFTVSIPDDANYKVDSVKWINLNTEVALGKNDTFKAGYEYRLAVKLSAINGREFMFDDDDDLHSITTKAYFNNNPADYDIGKVYYDTVTVVVDYIFTADISKATVTGVVDKDYTGKAVSQTAAKVYYDGQLLVKGTDYTVGYINAVALGASTMVINGIGRFTGSKKVAFKIQLAKPKVSVYAVTDSTVTLRWAKVAGASYYNVYEYNAAKKTYTLVLTRFTGTAYKFAKRNPGATYLYLIRTVYKNAKGATTMSPATIKDLVKAVTLCKAPTVKARVLTGRMVRLMWAKCAGAKYYQVYEYNAKTKTYKKLVASTTNLTYLRRTTAGTHYYLVRAVNSAGAASAFSTKNLVKVLVR